MKKEKRLSIEKFEALSVYTLSVEKKITQTENEVLTRYFKKLQSILSSDGMKQLFADQIFDSYMENLSLINDNLNNLEKAVNAYPDNRKHDVVPQSGTPLLFKSAPKFRFTLLEGCMASSKLLQEYHKNEITELNAYKLWSEHEKYEFLSDEMKNLRRKAEHLDLRINSLTCAEYYELFQLITRLEDQVRTSIKAVMALEIDKIAVIDKDWLNFIACGHGLAPGFASLKTKLKALPGLLSVHGKPEGADVYVASKKAGILPLNDAPFAPGKYEIRVSAKDHKEFREKVRIYSIDKTLVTLDLKAWKDCMEWIDPVTGMAFVYVAAGSFQMGDFKYEKPVHEVCLNGFFIGRYPVTQEEWEKIMGNNPSRYEAKSRPVCNVSWEDCQEFIDKFNSLSTEGKFSLPTEAQWEFAARGGNKSRGYKYAGSDNLDEVAWHANSANSENSDYAACDIGLKKGNELGLYDMSGNVKEWCQDWIDSNYYETSPLDNPQGALSGSNRVFRGGSWDSSAYWCRSTFRYGYVPWHGTYSIGFRLVLSPGQQ